MHTATDHSPHAFRQALPFAAVTLTGGFWGKRQAVNRDVSLRHGYQQLDKAGNFHNLRLAAGQATGTYQGFRFLDSDLYKWLEAVSYALAAGPDPDLDLAGMANATIDLLAAAQQPDGYLNAYYQVVKPGERWTDLDHGHELYCAGHLFQAAVAHHRATGSPRLLEIACRFADHIDATFGPGRRQGACGHPEIEMALVELYRETGAARYRDLAAFFLDQRGQRRMRGLPPYGPEYQQDHVPVRDVNEVAGHAVRQLYLNSGLADMYLETGEPALLAAAERLWHDGTAHKMHVTGGFGARFDGEAFGEAYELPSDRSYCETCAAIAALMFNWRMLLATPKELGQAGAARYADAFERALYNGFLSGVALDGRAFFYVNPLHSRAGATRQPWYACACCPPNVMRQVASVEHFLATHSAAGVQLHQYAPAELQIAGRALRIETNYPWDGDVRVTVAATDGAAWELALRLPPWAEGATAELNGTPLAAPLTPGAYATVARAWQPGDVLVLHLPLTPRLTQAHPRVDALRGSLVIERGPLVYCLEQADQPAGVVLLDVQVDAHAVPQAVKRPDLLGGIVAIAAPGYHVDPAAWSEALYFPAAAAPLPRTPLTLTAVPYYAWANRSKGAMRVWLPAG